MQILSTQLSLFFDDDDDRLRAYCAELFAAGHSRRAWALYNASRPWARLRRARFELAGHKCERCHREGVPLQLHHLSYENRFHENLDDVCALCRDCHAWMIGLEANDAA